MQVQIYKLTALRIYQLRSTLRALYLHFYPKEGIYREVYKRNAAFYKCIEILTACLYGYFKATEIVTMVISLDRMLSPYFQNNYTHDPV